MKKELKIGYGEKNNPRSRWYQKHKAGQMPIVSDPIGVSYSPVSGKKKTLWQRIIDFFRGR